MSSSDERYSCILACSNTTNLFCFDECYSKASWKYVAPGAFPAWVTVLSSALLLVLSALFSGLTLGLMSLDVIGLDIIAQAGEAEERKYAKAILPVRSKGNLLLCTLLLGNTAVNSFIAILLADLTDGPIGLVTSTLAIVTFGEIGPQAACSRHGLAIGAHTIWIVKCFIFLLFPFAWPISKFLDKILGRDLGNFHTQDELKHLVKIHVEHPDAREDFGAISSHDGNMLTGALEYKEKRVSDVMTTLDKVFMIDNHTRLTFTVLMSIYRSGFTRVPVYETSRNNIIGILFTKDLILIDPDDEIEVAAVLSFHGNREGGYVRSVCDNTTLDKVFMEFKASYLHMLLAYATTVNEDIASPEQKAESLNHSLPVKNITGIITLEDVIEAVIKDEIVDETDNYIDVNDAQSRVKSRGSARRPNPTNFMKLFEHKHFEGYERKLSPSEVNAVVAFLSVNVPEFKEIAKYEPGILRKLVQMSVLEDQNDSLGDEFDVNIPEQNNASNILLSTPGIHTAIESESRVIYSKGVPADSFILVLQGRVVIVAGSDNFESEIGPWCYLGQKALSSESDNDYVPDFRAYSKSGPIRLLRIRRSDYISALNTANISAFDIRK
jgi:metal transporter CNNM